MPILLLFWCVESGKNACQKHSGVFSSNLKNDLMVCSRSEKLAKATGCRRGRVNNSVDEAWQIQTVHGV